MQRPTEPDRSSTPSERALFVNAISLPQNFRYGFAPRNNGLATRIGAEISWIFIHHMGNVKVT